jgi:type II secretory pathway pseudopilin PulG
VNRLAAFTLVEVLVVIAITGIIGSMLAVAIRGANRQAQGQRAESQIDRLNMLMLQIYEQETERMPPVPPASATNFSPDQRALMGLMWKREWLRCALPDRREDIRIPNDPTSNHHPPVRIPTATITGVNVDLEDAEIPPDFTSNPSYSPGGHCSAAVFRHQQYIAQAIGAAKGVTVNDFDDLLNNTESDGEWTAEHQSAECLYMILATRIVNGEPAIDSLRTSEIGDTDEDGMPEVLDAWGRPVGFMRWPAGYSLPLEWQPARQSSPPIQLPTDSELAERKTQLGRDVLDVIFVDPRYHDLNLANHQANDPFPLFPMIISAGNDGVFDLYGLDNDPSLSPDSPPLIDYVDAGLNPRGRWPVAPSGLPTSQQPFWDRLNADQRYDFSFNDPYLVTATVDKMLGARVDSNKDGDDNTADNVVATTDFQ